MKHLKETTYPVGTIVASPGALGALREGGTETFLIFLLLHASRGRCPTCLQADESTFKQRLSSGSKFTLPSGTHLLVLTEAERDFTAIMKSKVRDYFSQGGCKWLCLHEKGGRIDAIPCHHNLQQYLDEYVAAAGIASDPDGRLFRTTGRKTGQQHGMWQQDGYRMIQRHARHAGIMTKIGNHTFRATRITVYLKAGGRLEVAQKMAAHASAQTTELYDRQHDEVSHDEANGLQSKAFNGVH